MVDFDFFRSRSFLGANIVAFIVSFAMLAMFFFLALYMQNILGYSPLEAGVRFLPSTLVIMVAGPIAGPPDRPHRPAPADHHRPAAGRRLAVLAVATSPSTRATASCAGAFVLMGVGMGLMMSPMSTAAMNAVDRRRRASPPGTLSMSRMVGGTFGVAALGALVAALGRHRPRRSCCRTCRTRRARKLADALGSGAGTNASGRTAGALQDAFVYALDDGLRIGAGASRCSARSRPSC